MRIETGSVSAASLFHPLTTMAPPSKAKILCFGSIGDNPDLFLKKLTALHRSRAGPFDAAFVVGECRTLEPLTRTQPSSPSPLPLPVYLHHLPEDLAKPPEGAEEADNNDSPLKLAENLFLLTPRGQARIWSLPIGVSGAAGGSSSSLQHSLIVAACPPRLRVDAAPAQPLLSGLSHVSYIGCDLLLTEELPQGTESLVGGEGGILPSSFDAADVALRARARYHFCPSPTNTFHQSPPFRHLASATATSPILHTGRFLTLASVSDTNDKAAKCVHALGLSPLLSLGTLELHEQQRQPGLLPSPYTDASYPADHHHHHHQSGPNGGKGRTAAPPSLSSSGLSEASARRILAEERRNNGPGGSALSQRWAPTGAGYKRRRPTPDEDGDGDDSNVDETTTTLFVHGLHKDPSGRLQSRDPGDGLLLKALAQWGVVEVRRPPNAATSSFAFVEFSTHDQARRCLEETGREVVVTGVHLQLKWAAVVGGAKPRYWTEAQAKDSSTLYFKMIQRNDSDDTAPAQETRGESIRQWAEAVLESALNEGVDGVGDRVTAADEPALRVEVRVVSAFGFLDFASHAAASMAIATLTGSVDGGAVLEDAPHRPSPLHGLAMNVHWGHRKEEISEIDNRNVIEGATGFKFQRKHFPADARQDCWFCLASEGCEKHLITAVFELCYAAMPKGPVHPGHTLLIPVQHSSRGALTDPPLAQEMEDVKAKLRRHAASAYDCDLFVFERAIQTRGGYHTHVQCVPVERQLGPRLLTTLLAQAEKYGMDLREIKSDISAASLLDAQSHDDNTDAGYFYVEIPVAGSGCRRFLHRHRNGSRALVPLQLGREALAAVLGKPDLAHWKSCVLDKEQEANLAKELRDSLASAS